MAIVDAYDNPNAEKDLAFYRNAYGLPACTTANGCFRKVNQRGTAKAPTADGGWGQEISLDLDMVSAACPACKILLVEADSSRWSDLAAAVNTAAKLKAKAISNSYGGLDTPAKAAWDHRGIAVVASTGAWGYEVDAPASFPSVVALADPDTGVAGYDSYALDGAKGWMVFGGTSASAPITGSIYASGGHTDRYPASYTWAYAKKHPMSLFDVTIGSNGSCSPAIWCKAHAGWDGPTGLGTPNGLGAF